jgi:hypothetical protein
VKARHDGPRRARPPRAVAELRASGYDLIAEGYRRLAEAERDEGDADRDVYSTRAGEEPPEMVNCRRYWRDVVAPKIGRKPYANARWWIVDRADWVAWRAEHTVLDRPANDATSWTPAKAMASAGLRAAGKR